MLVVELVFVVVLVVVPAEEVSVEEVPEDGQPRATQ